MNNWKTFPISRPVRVLVSVLLLGLVTATALNCSTLFPQQTPQTPTQLQQRATESPLPRITSAPTQTDPTAGWNEYSNRKFGYTFRYPSSMMYREWKPAADILHSVSFYLTEDSNRPSYQAPEIAVTIFANPQKQTSKDWFQDHTKPIRGSAALFQGATVPISITVGGLESLHFRELSGGTHAERILLARGNTVFSISCTDVDGGKLKQFYWRIVSTLRWNPIP